VVGVTGEPATLRMSGQVASTLPTTLCAVMGSGTGPALRAAAATPVVARGHEPG
jgi:hypothetical protein